MTSMASSTPTTQPDEACLAAVDLARAAAEETAGVIGVGDYLGAQAEDTRVVSHFFDCPHPGYHGWRWSVTVARAARARSVTVDEVVLLPGEDALQAKTWVPWVERIQPGDVTPGVLLPITEDDPRLEPGYTGGDEPGAHRRCRARIGPGARTFGRGPRRGRGPMAAGGGRSGQYAQQAGAR